MPTAQAPIGYRAARIKGSLPNPPTHGASKDARERPDAGEGREVASPRLGVNHLDFNALLEENKQLRELVVQLSEIVVRNVLDRSPGLPPPARER
jgi:hypothetical protein